MSRNLVPNQFDYSGIYVEGSRSQFRFNKPYKGTCMAGMLYPFGDPIRVFPGTKNALRINANIISNTMVAVPLDGMYIDFFTVWVPDRIVWTHQPQFLGENDTTAWTQNANYSYPSVDFNVVTNTWSSLLQGNGAMSMPDVTLGNVSLSAHFGLIAERPLVQTDAAYAQTINVLAYRGYYATWNYLFRDENYQRPVLFSKGDTGSSGEFGYLMKDYDTGSSEHITDDFGQLYYGLPIENAVVMPVCKFHDAFTSLLPQPQFGNSVGLGVGSIAPVLLGSSVGQTANIPFDLGAMLDQKSDGYFNLGQPGNQKVLVTNSQTSATNTGFLVADLANALGTINSFRANVMTQRFLEALARGGRRVPELYESIYGVKNTVAAKDYPELITHERYVMGVQQVVATADSGGTGWTSHLGDRGAYSLTVLRDIPCSEKDFTEFGYLHVLYCIRSTNQYSQIIPQHFTRKLLLDEYNPYFDHIGDVDVPNHLVNNIAGTAGNFGYQEAWWFERTQQGVIAGALNKAYGSLGYHVVGEVFDSNMVTCTPGYLAFDPAVFNDVFVSPYWAYPQFLVDGVIKGRSIKRMSQHSVPGIVGRI